MMAPDRPLKQWARGIPFEVKSVDDEARTFRGLAAAWSLDHGNDIIEKGAFKRTLHNWRGSKGKRPVYLLNAHNAWDVQDVVGKMVEAEETDEGLDTTWQFVAKGDPAADAAYTRVKDGFVTGLSIGYTPVPGQVEMVTRDGRQVRLLKELQLHEVSLVIFPMNEDARIDTASVKSLLRDGLTDDVKELFRALPEEQKQDLRALLDSAPETPAPADRQSFAGIRSRMLTLKIRQLAMRAEGLGLAPGDRTLITEVSDHGNDCGKAA